MEDLNRITNKGENSKEFKPNGDFLKEKKLPNYPKIFGVVALIVWFIQVFIHLLKHGGGMYGGAYSLGFIIGSLFGVPIYFLIGQGIGTFIRFIIKKAKKRV